MPLNPLLGDLHSNLTGVGWAKDQRRFQRLISVIPVLWFRPSALSRPGTARLSRWTARSERQGERRAKASGDLSSAIGAGAFQSAPISQPPLEARLRGLPFSDSTSHARYRRPPGWRSRAERLNKRASLSIPPNRGRRCAFPSPSCSVASVFPHADALRHVAARRDEWSPLRQINSPRYLCRRFFHPDFQATRVTRLQRERMGAIAHALHRVHGLRPEPPRKLIAA